MKPVAKDSSDVRIASHYRGTATTPATEKLCHD